MEKCPECGYPNGDHTNLCTGGNFPKSVEEVEALGREVRSGEPDERFTALKVARQNLCDVEAEIEYTETAIAKLKEHGDGKSEEPWVRYKEEVLTALSYVAYAAEESVWEAEEALCEKFSTRVSFPGRGYM